MLTLLCFAALAAYVMTAPGHNLHNQHSVVIDYTNGLFYEDLARRYMVLVIKDGCYFWHLTHAEAQTGLSPSGIRHIEGNFIAALEKGVSLTGIHRSNFNHMAPSIVAQCRDVNAYLIHRDHIAHVTDLNSVDLQGTLPPNITIIHGTSQHN